MSVCVYLPPLLCRLQSTMTLDDGKLVHIQKWDGKETSLVREVDGDALTLVSSAPTRQHTHILFLYCCSFITLVDRLPCLHDRHSQSETLYPYVAT